jgi:hypothetical protein
MISDVSGLPFASAFLMYASMDGVTRHIQLKSFGSGARFGSLSGNHQVFSDF